MLRLGWHNIIFLPEVIQNCVITAYLPKIGKWQLICESRLNYVHRKFEDSEFKSSSFCFNRKLICSAIISRSESLKIRSDSP